MYRILDVGTSVGATLARLASGAQVGALGPRPAERLTLYDFEGCPYCRKVREAFTVLDLEALVLPCPKRGQRYRPELEQRGGRAQFPYLVDPNTGKEMYESDDIIRYLFQQYGAGDPPGILKGGVLADLGSALASAFRPGFGAMARVSRAPEQPLVLYSFEASPFCRIVRETLTCLELPYVLYNVAKGSPSRAAFLQRSGRMQVPYLADPNTSTELFESADIVAYLEATYAAPR